MKLHDIKPNARVVYVGGNQPEWGTVVRCNDTYAFVRFDGQLHAQACHPEDLEEA